MSERKVNKYRCSNHPNVEAVVFCDTCEMMQGCSGYLCKECDGHVHSVFTVHKRTEPGNFWGKACSKHPGHNTKETFCQESQTFHCASCAHESGVKSEPTAVVTERTLESSRTGVYLLEKDIAKLSGHIDKISHELDAQKIEAMHSIQTTFNQLRELIEQREKALMRDFEELYNAKASQLYNETTELSKIIEQGKSIMQAYNSLPAAKDANTLKSLLDIKSVMNKISDMSKRCEVHDAVQARIEVAFEDADKLIAEIANLGVVSETTDIPPPQSLKATEVGYDHACLEWDPLEMALPVSYSVMYKEASESDGKWTECYNGQETTCRCANLRESTDYNFRVAAVYNGKKITCYSTCSAKTVK